MDVIGDAETIQDHGKWDEDHGCGEEIEDVFWFGNAVVASCEADGEDASYFAGEIAPRKDKRLIN